MSIIVYSHPYILIMRPIGDRNDIGPPVSWDQLIRIINQLVPITSFAGPGHWNDLDLLEVGNAGLTDAEQQTHFSFWSAVK
jgi:alpha-galactosidase